MSRYQIDEGSYPLRSPRAGPLIVLEHDHVGAIEGGELTDLLKALEVLLRAMSALHAPVHERMRPFENGVSKASRRREDHEHQVCACTFAGHTFIDGQ
jgi:hypothetical protein